MKYRRHLPQLDGGLFLTDGGMETTFIFHDGIDLPEFASFPLLDTEQGVDALRRYYARYASLAREHGAGFVGESPTWRASRDWGARLGYSAEDLDRVNRAAVALLAEVRAEYAGEPFVISGCIGPQSDAYQPAQQLIAEAAEDYHRAQVATFAETDADMVTALTLTYVAEAVGIVRAAQAAGLPSAISFTVETDGKLPSGQALSEAIEEVDAETGSAAGYFMINCAHPTHFLHLLDDGGAWQARVWGIRANASRKSHAELDEADELDEGDSDELAARYVELRERMPHVNVLGGCCGTDHRHVAALAAACIA